MKIKVNIKEFLKNNWILILIWLAVALFLMQFWSLKMAGLSNPISHTPDVVDGGFIPTVGEIREITVVGYMDYTPFTLNIDIHDEEGNSVWTYENDQFVASNKVQILASFDRENPLKVVKDQKYYADIEYNGFFPISISVLEYSGNFKKSYTVLSILILIALSVIFVIYRSNLPIHYRFAMLALTLAMCMGYVMPPFSAADEASHFAESYSISSRVLGKEVADEYEHILLRADDFDSINSFHDAASISEWYSTFKKGDVDELVPYWALRSVVTYAKYVYFPSALGVSLSRLFSLSGHMLLILGRLFNLFAVIAIVAYSIYIIPKGKVFVACLGLLPEVLFFSNSFSYDGMNFALTILYVSYFYKLYEQEEKIKLKQVILLIVFFVLMVPIKYVYVWLGVLFLFLPLKKMDISKKQFAILGSVLLILGMAIAVIVVPRVYTMMTDGRADSTGVIGSNGVTLSYIKDNFQSFKLTMFNTVFQNLNGFKYPDQYVRNSFGMMMGEIRYGMGTDAYMIPIWMCSVIVVVLLVGLSDIEENRLGGLKRVVTGGAGLLAYFSVILAMFFAATVVENAKVYGIDGRYIVPIYSVIPLVVENKFFKIKFDAKKVCLLVMAIICLMFIFDGYYHYAYVYFAQPDV